MRAVARLSLLLTLPLGVAAKEVPFALVDPTAPDVAAVREAGQLATGAIATKLLAELTVALANGNPAAAVEVCHLKALPTTAQKLADLPAVTTVKRTSLRLRNPANAPDAAEQQVLDHVAQLLAQGEEMPPVLVQRIGAAASPTAWRVYRPIVVQETCLACHGERTAQSPALRAALLSRYPRDAALGYRAGEWRGLIGATIAADPAEHTARPPAPRQ